jgi:hypothetical protein
VTSEFSKLGGHCICYTWEMDNIEFPKIDRTAFSVTTFEEAEREDKEYWLSRTPRERLLHMRLLRSINYGSHATARLQRVLEITERT